MILRKYKVFSSTNPSFENIEIDLDLSHLVVGDEYDFLNNKFQVTQTGEIFILSSSSWILSLQDITPEKEEQKEKLIFNDNIDIFLETKEIDVRVKCTYKELYVALGKEWEVFVRNLLRTQGRNCVFPLEYDEDLKLLTFYNDWKFSEGSLQYLSEGSFSRKDKEGRNI